MLRFMDDITAINDSGGFRKANHEIYLSYVELKYENSSDNEASFLDADIKIVYKVFFDLCDKSFSFSIVRTPYLCSNMPSKIFYASLRAKILRTGRTTAEREKFKLSCAIYIYIYIYIHTHTHIIYI